ncbi:hypothetical protein F4558_002785 [Micromonospora profundi]|nr:hypothetical protein [Micromonospora profundi]
MADVIASAMHSLDEVGLTALRVLHQDRLPTTS